MVASSPEEYPLSKRSYGTNTMRAQRGGGKQFSHI